MGKAKISIVGLGVMGANLARNIARNGFSVVGYDLDAERTRTFIDKFSAEGEITGAFSFEDLINSLEKPRCVWLMVPAGKPVDDVIDSLQLHLEEGDILIDGGNSFFQDTERRSSKLEEAGIRFIGTGVSGGELGALWGPAIMPGGQTEAWEAVKIIFEAIAAKVGDDPCVTHIGPRGAGHYVKMVHNGIEYGDMQLIAEAYDILHRGVGLSAQELHQVFTEWNEGELGSYLVEITRDIFAKKDDETGKPLVDLILDEAKQKGTGKWTSQSGLDLGAPTPTINAAVESRIVSAFKIQRVAASKVISGPEIIFDGERDAMVTAVRNALYAAKICSYAQGMSLLQAASLEYDYNLKLDEIAKIWRGGCIIRARLLGDIRAAYSDDPELANLLLNTTFKEAVENRQMDLRTVVQTSVGMGIPCLAMSASLAYFDAYRTARLPANLTQAQRDYFGAHKYRRIDKEGNFHTEWNE